MALRVLLFSKSPDTNAALAQACEGAGMQLEVCADIFSAIEKGTKQSFSCVLADWSDQPEAGFLLKRARESAPNLKTVAIAIVDREPKAAEMREHRLDFLIFRPVVPSEAQDVLAKASEGMQPAGAPARAPAAVRENRSGVEPPAETEENSSQRETGADGGIDAAANDAEPGAGTEDESTAVVRPPRHIIRNVVALAAVLAAAYYLWNARDTIRYLARTPESKKQIFKEAIAQMFYLNPSGATSVGAASTDAQQDAYFSRNAATSTVAPELGVASSESDVAQVRIPMRPPADFPLQTPVYVHADPPPVQVQRTAIPESLRNSAPITPPVVVTVNPATMTPVQAPTLTPASAQSFAEPVVVNEQTARSLLVRSVTPAYPSEAASQKLHGPVVLQTTISREGAVEDVKIVRGPYVLSKAAVSAVKQWRFQPYMVNGRPAQTQTTITINFTAPPG